MTRPDITNAVRAAARHSHNPSNRHWEAVLKILAYLDTTKELGITFRRGAGIDLSIFADADFSNDRVDSRSVSGVTVILGGMTILASSSTQHSVTTSSWEAEYIALGDGMKHALHAKSILDYLQPGKVSAPITLFEDNMGANILSENPLSQSRTKHIYVRRHFGRDLVRTNVFEVTQVASEDQHADVLTKLLRRNLFCNHRDFLMIII